VRIHKATFNQEGKREREGSGEKERERAGEGSRTQEGRKEGRKEGYMEGERTHGGCPDKYYCNYTLRFISCERALMGVDGIIYYGTLIKIIIRALNRGEWYGNNVHLSVRPPMVVVVRVQVVAVYARVESPFIGRHNE